jgi:hypothetical protein
VNTLELYPSEKAHTIMTEAGSAAEIVRHQSDFTIVRLPNKHEYALKPVNTDWNFFRSQILVSTFNIKIYFEKV